jgi:hypothetical protein
MTSGCVLVGVTDISQPSDQLPGAIELPGIGVMVVPHNEGEWRGLIGVVPVVPIWEQPERPRGGFWVSVWLDPEGEDFTFDPRAVVLRVRDGAALAPSAFTRPRQANVERRSRWPPCAFPRGQSPEASAPISITQIACVDMRFDVDPPPPEQRFSVLVSGIRRAGQAHPSVEVSFQEGKRWEFGVLP